MSSELAGSSTAPAVGRAATYRPEADGPPPVQGREAPVQWGALQRVGFRFAALYFVLYLLPFPVDYVPGASVVTGWYTKAWEAVVPWVGANVLRLAAPITVLPNGSGDTTWSYVHNLLLLVLAAAGTLLWTALDRRRPGYAALHDWVRLYVRYGLGATMLTYGAIKVIKSQFPNPGLERLIEPWGQFSPMGVVWSFMGMSIAYNLLTGLGEALGGVLLFWRRTTTLGALVSVAVLSNVVVLNYAYDVPVKLFSTNLLLMACFLALPDARRLLDMFVLNRAVAPAAIRTPVTGRWPRRGWLLAKAAIVGFFLHTTFGQAWQGRTQFGDLAPKPPLYGIWDVEAFERNGRLHEPLVTDPVRWRRMVFSRPNTVAVQLMSDSLYRYALQADTVAARLAVSSSRRDSTAPASLAYVREAPDRLVLRGTLGADSVTMRLRRVDERRFLVTSRGFHWVNEYPLNR